MTRREAPGGDPPSSAAPAQAVDAARVQELRVARAQALTRVQDLAETLAQEEAEAEKLAWAHGQATERFEADVRTLARRDLAGRPVTQVQWAVLGRERGLERQLAQDLAVKRAQVAATAQGLARARSRVQELERALALAMAQARTVAWEQALARSPRLRAIAAGRFLRRLLQSRTSLWDGLVDGIVRNLYLGMRVVGVLVWMLPTADARSRWKNESYEELEELKQEGAPLLGNAVRIALRTPWLALVLWTGAWRRSAARWLPRLKPLWIGLATAAATFLGAAAGIGQSPTEQQMRMLVTASTLSGLSGALAACQGSRGRWHRRRKRRRR